MQTLCRCIRGDSNVYQPGDMGEISMGDVIGPWVVRRQRIGAIGVRGKNQVKCTAAIVDEGDWNLAGCPGARGGAGHGSVSVGLAGELDLPSYYRGRLCW